MTNIVTSCANCYEETYEQHRQGWESVIKIFIDIKLSLFLKV